MKSIMKKSNLMQSKRTNRSQSQHQVEEHSSINSRRISNNNNNLSTYIHGQSVIIINQNKQQHYSQQSIQEIIDTFKLYVKSAIDLKMYLNVSSEQPQQTLTNDNYQQKQKQQSIISNTNITTTKNPTNTKNNVNKLSQQLTLITSKLTMFITTTQTQLNKLHKTIQSSSLTQLKSIPNNYHQILTYTKQKYSLLLKQTYRTLNIQTLLSHQQLQLNEEDLLIVKQNKKRKLEQIKLVENELQELWNEGNKLQNRNNNISRNNKGKNNRSTNNRGRQNLQNFQQQEIIYNNQQPQQINSLLINFSSNTSTNPRNLQILNPTNNIQQLNLRQLARQQLQKQFLSIRIQAYNIYQQYIQHQHTQHQERLRFVKQEQDILESQLNEEVQLAQQIRQEFYRLRRELDQVKTINQLIKKRYVLRESMRIDSDNSLYQ